MTSIARPSATFNLSGIVDGQPNTAASVTTPLTQATSAIVVAQQYVSVSPDDDNIKHLNDALLVSGGGITKTIANPGGDEKLVFAVDNAAAVWNAGKLQGREITTASPQVGNALVWNGTEWGYGTWAGGGGSTVNPGIPGLRLVASTSVVTAGEPFNANDVTVAQYLHYRPYLNSIIRLYDGSNWNDYDLGDGLTSDLNIQTPGTNVNYDVFLTAEYSLLGPTLVYQVWNSNIDRGILLTRLDGVLVSNSDSRRRYIGTIRTGATAGRTEDSNQRRFVWNYYNRISRKLRVQDTSAPWTYGSTSLRRANNSVNNRVEMVIGWSEDQVNLDASLRYDSGGTGVVCRIGLDSTTVAADDLPGLTKTTETHARATYRGNPGAGYHFLGVLEAAHTGATTTISAVNSSGEMFC
jgi:hypothetical protein